MEAYLPILQSLSAAGIAYCTIGTWALRAYFPLEMQDYVLQDCDVLLEPGWENVRHAISVLQEKGWQVTVWEQDLDANVTAAFLQGKFYLRARLAALTLDLTYECASIQWQAIEAEMAMWQRLPLASIRHIAVLKRLKSTPKDIALMKRLEI